ncbi:BQ2448_6699 [Microbotryum intermedium]|uniref:BQ2448_6699 protein n=1 Tax=Microbotryum intermedium TaxID=269621 RepID=A0A238FLW6_9BASI|nr:BQ2448_6699 [Microbotryum intermedium]
MRDPPKAYTPYSDAMPPTNEGWSAWFSRHGKQKGTVAVQKGIAWSDWLGIKMNGLAEAVSLWCIKSTLLRSRIAFARKVAYLGRIVRGSAPEVESPSGSTTTYEYLLPRSVPPQTGSERFYPVTGDFTAELEKVTRILQSFTVDGIEGAVAAESKTASGATRKVQRKVMRKIPAKVIRDAKGVAIFTSMRSGIAPLGGAGGAGMVIARLEDGSWSAPSSVSPNNLSLGLMLGVDIYDAVLILRTQEVLEAFMGHTVTLGAELGVAAGPYGAGAVAETGKSRVPILSYIAHAPPPSVHVLPAVRNRGMYAGFEAVAQVYVTRTEENENAYFWPGITPRDILTGKVRAPREAEALHQALEAAETGEAQRVNGDEFEFEQPFFETEDLASSLDEGEVLRLPPTPAQVEEEEAEESRAEAIKARNEKRYLR